MKEALLGNPDGSLSVEHIKLITKECITQK
jgi:hypothetical protein